MIFPWVYRHNNPQLIDQAERAHWFGYYIKADKPLGMLEEHSRNS